MTHPPKKHYSLFLLAPLSAILSYWMANVVHAMREVVGITFASVLIDAAVPLVLLGGAFVVVISVFVLVHKTGQWRFVLLMLSLGWILGVFATEAMIHRDELSFAREARQASTTGAESYGRDRAWPNTGTSLIWNADTGIHATD